MGDLIDEAARFFIVFFVVVEPITLVPVFSALTEGATDRWRHRMAIKAVTISFGVLVLFALAGSAFIRLMGISIDAFRIAGGVMLFLMALDMVFARESGAKQTSDEKAEATKRADISVFPLAFPFIAGPGALAVTLLTFGSIEASPALELTLIGVILAVMLITLALLWLTPTVMRLLGVTGAHVVSRLAGVVLAALAVQFMVDGLKGAFAVE